MLNIYAVYYRAAHFSSSLQYNYNVLNEPTYHVISSGPISWPCHPTKTDKKHHIPHQIIEKCLVHLLMQLFSQNFLQDFERHKRPLSKFTATMRSTSCSRCCVSPLASSLMGIYRAVSNQGRRGQDPETNWLKKWLLPQNFHSLLYIIYEVLDFTRKPPPGGEVLENALGPLSWRCLEHMILLTIQTTYSCGNTPGWRVVWMV